MNKFTRKAQGGQVFIILALSLVVLVGALGLAVDSGLGYLIKARLNAAVDAAAVAGARAVVHGDNEAEQRQQAETAARNFFAANYPAGYLGSTAGITGTQVEFNSPARGQITVKVQAHANTAVSFMRVFGFNTLDIEATAHTTRRDIDMAFVMDTSSSLVPVAAEIRQHAATFMSGFSSSTDRMSLIHFSNGAEVDEPIRTGPMRGFDKRRIVQQIAGLQFKGATNSVEGLWHARQQLNRVTAPDRSSLRVIVLFSDGTPNSLASVFKFQPWANCTASGVISTTDDVLMREAPRGLWDQDRTQELVGGGCGQNRNLASILTPNALPDWYNAHGINDREFPIVGGGPRLVQNDTSTPERAFVNINHAARNMVEALAARARAEGIHVFTLGLGPLLQQAIGPELSSDDTGENIMKCMANTPDALPRCRAAGADQPVGVYCHARTADDLQPCFANMRAEILRITR
ncbi:VWA domain-containing protein [Noviherbaspirillum aerium]|uniref:VWA domain-containing protein n=1 Tax=Noviherbaspirillum aerium TaxID=2588497 RepID=UPI00124E8A1C|nr:VWA domain-containing protein [Noviherbaspirillum aerium]